MHRQRLGSPQGARPCHGQHQECALGDDCLGLAQDSAGEPLGCFSSDNVRGAGRLVLVPELEGGQIQRGGRRRRDAAGDFYRGQALGHRRPQESHLELGGTGDQQQTKHIGNSNTCFRNSKTDLRTNPFWIKLYFCIEVDFVTVVRLMLR